MAEALRVVFADNEAIDYNGIAGMLASADGIVVERGVRDADALMAAVQELQPDAVVTDIEMPPKMSTDGIDAALAIRRLHPKVGVVVLTQYRNPQYALTLFSQGASGIAYLLKSRVPEVRVLVNAIREVHAGGTVVDPQIIEGWTRLKKKMADSHVDELTDTELHVLRLVAEGKNNDQIADATSTGKDNVEKHVSHIYSKLGIDRSSGSGASRVLAVLKYLATLREQDAE